ncbi:MAG: rhodanese-like domain-containing protein [Sinobacteraceae bacterium]|nr:rhodanese-like domain-containing protein [Nevskia sp.]MDI3259960.1 rhodanese-like domain-containing protein [Nevskiaceae bacterium]
MAQFLEFFHHHVYLFVALGVLLVLFLANELHGHLSGGVRLGPIEAVRLINDREPLVIDVRAPADYKKGHLLNAVNLPLAKLEERIGELAKERQRPVLVYCALGGAALEAAQKLRKLGFVEVYPLRGGLNGWLNSNLPVTSK